MVHIETICKDNFNRVIRLELTTAQKEVICDNVFSLAQAYACQDACSAFAIYNDDEVVGFLLLENDEVKKYFSIWRIMMGKDYQGKGYGKKALILAINFLKEKGAKVIHISHQTNNYDPSELYQKVGFKYTGIIEDGEVLMEYQVV